MDAQNPEDNNHIENRQNNKDDAAASREDENVRQSNYGSRVCIAEANVTALKDDIVIKVDVHPPNVNEHFPKVI